MTEFGEDEFIFKKERVIAPKHPRAFMHEVDTFLEELGVFVDPRDIEITGEILHSTDEEVAKALFLLYEQAKNIRDNDSVDAACEFILNHINMQRLILHAREITQAS